MEPELRKPQALHERVGARRILAVSDIHGHLDLFDRLLQKMRYRPGEDALVVIGDLVQRGAQNLGVVRRCMELGTLPNVYVLQGNNDLFVLSDRYQRLLEVMGYYGERTFHGEIAKALGRPIPTSLEEMAELSRLAKEAYPVEHEFLRTRPHILETENFLFAHAGLASEDLEHQELGYVIEQDRFFEKGAHVFKKLLLVGHWPVANYRFDKLSNAPLYSKEKNILSIDGGNGVKNFGQLNGVILDNETGEWSWTSTDGYATISAPCSQEACPGTVITWPENYVDILESFESYSRCRAWKTGAQLEIPNEFLYQDEGTFRTSDITSARLEVQKGEPLSVIWRSKDRMLVMKDGEAGFLFLA